MASGVAPYAGMSPTATATVLAGAADPMLSSESLPGGRFTLDSPAFPGYHPEETTQAVVVRPDEPVQTSELTVYPRPAENSRQDQEFLRFVPNHFTRVRVRSEAEYEDDRKVLQLRDINPPDATRILYLRLDDLASTVGSKTIATLGAMVSAFRNLQIDRFVLPDLSYCDLTLNNIQSLDQVSTMATNCPNITTLDLTANPLLTKTEWKESGWKVVAMLTYLNNLNGSDVTLDQHILANRRHGTVDDQRRLALRIFDEAFMQRAASSSLASATPFSMDAWTPESVVSLDLSKCQLQVFHVGSLVNLRTLNLAHNFLTRITMGGLAACHQLSSLDVTKNLLADHSNIEYLKLLPALTVLRVSGNPLTEDRHHRLDIVFHTNACRGTPTSPGLQMLDRKPVTMSERVQAFHRFCDVSGARSKDIAAAIFKWRLILTAHFGQLPVDQLCNAGQGIAGGASLDDPAVLAAAVETAKAAEGVRPPGSVFAPLVAPHGPLARLRMLTLQNQELTIVDVRGMASLEVLDLRGNNLQGAGILGLNELRRLRVLDVTGNPLSSSQDVLAGLCGRVNDFGIPKLKTLTHEAPLSNLESVNLGLPGVNQSPDAPKSWWEDRAADPFLAITGASVKDMVMALVPNNRHLRRVEGTDLNPIAIAAAYQAALEWNEASTMQYTAMLSALMASVAPVTMGPSATGAAAGSGTSGRLVADVNEDSASQTYMHLRSHHPDHVLPGNQYDADSLKDGLNLGSLGLISDMAMDLSTFRNLRVLNLSFNKLTALDGMGLEGLTALERLDLHNNRLADLPALGALVDGLPSLQMVAVRDNPCTRDFDASRVELLGMVSRLRTLACTLRVVDVPITLDERVEAWKTAGGSDAEAESFRARVALQTRAPIGVPPVDVTELNLEGARLRQVDLTPYKGLEQLSLRDNSLTIESFRMEGRALGVPLLSNLAALDLRENDLEFSNADNLAAVMTVVNGLPALRSLGLCGNWDANDRRRVARGRTQDEAVAGVEHRTPAFSLTQEGRLQTLRQLPALKNPKSNLRFLDNVAITPAEVVDAFYGPQSGTSDHDRELHRFDIAYGQQVGSTPPGDMTTLDLSGNRLVAMRPQALAALHHLQYLHLQDNGLADDALGGLDTLPVIHLDLQRNQLADLPRLGALAHRMRSLRELNVRDNPCFNTEDPEARVKLLSHIQRAGYRGFRLNLNGTPVTVEERVRAVQLRKGTPVPDAASGTPGFAPADDEDTKRLRLSLVLDELSVDGTEPHVDLTNQRLQYVGDMAWSQRCFKSLRVLNLSSNHLRSLQGQGLGFLPVLQHLDLRDNQLTSLEDTIGQLEQCPELQVLYLRNSHQGASTATPNAYVKRVCGRLRGLISCDDIKSESQLKRPEELKAVELLRPACGVHANTVTNVDIRGQGLDHAKFLPIMSALTELPVKNLRMSDNPWDNDCDGQGHGYRSFVVSMLRGLRTLDGVAIDDTERASAVTFVHRLEDGERDKVNRFANFKVAQDGVAAALAGTSAALASKQLLAYDAVREGRLGPETVAVDPDFTPPAPTVAVAGAAAGSSSAPLPPAGPEEVKIDVDDGPTPSTPKAEALPPPVSTAPRNTGSLLNKIEISVQFFQLYSLILILGIGVQWPSLWVDIKEYYDWAADVLSIDVHGVYGRLDVDAPRDFEEYLRFGMLLGLQAAVLYFVFRAAKMKRSTWVQQYHTNWTCTKWSMLSVFIVCLLGVIVGGLFVDIDSADNVFNGDSYGHEAHVYWGTFGAVCSVTFVAWLAVVYVFKRHYQRVENSVVVVGGDKFDSFWVTFKQNLQHFVFFMLAIVYLPVSRAIAENFAPEHDRQTLQVFQCPFFDNDNLNCCLAGLPNRPCIDSDAYDGLSTMQFVALGFSVYVIGVPIFVALFLRSGTKEANKAYRPAEAPVTAAIKAKKEAIWAIRANGSLTMHDKIFQTREAEKELAALKRNRSAVYTNAVAVAPVAAQYGLWSYSRGWRYYKLVRLLELLAVLCFAMFLPTDTDRWLHLGAALVVCAIMFAVVVFLRPTVNTYEHIMDVSARFTNIVNLTMALALDRTDDTPDTVTNILVIGFNGINALVLLGGVFVVACLPSNKTPSKPPSEVKALLSPASPAATLPPPTSAPVRPTPSVPAPTRNTLDAGVMRASTAVAQPAPVAAV